MPDPRKDFALKLMADDPTISDADLAASLKIFDAKQAEQLSGGRTGIVPVVRDITHGLTEHPKETLKGFVTGAAEGVPRFGKKLGMNALGIGQMVLTPPADQATELGYQLAVTGLPRGKKEAVKLATGVDLNGGSPEIGADIATAVLLGGLGSKKFGTSVFRGGSSPRGLVTKVPAASSTATTLGDAAGLAAKTTTETTPIAKGPLSAPMGSRFSIAREVNPRPEATITGTGSTSTGIRQKMSAPSPSNEITLRVPVDKQAAANGTLVAEDAAELAKSGKASYSGTERRGPARIVNEVEDRQYQNVRESIARKNAKARAQATLMKPVESSAKKSAPLVDTQIKNEIPKPKEIGAEKGALSGFTKQPTKSLAQMVADYGEQGAANRAGMSPEELRLRIEFADDAPGMHKASLDRYGATRTNRMFGTQFESSKRIPAESIPGIKAAAEKELARDGHVSEKTQTLLDRIKSERGRVKAGTLLAGGGAGGGALLGGSIGKNEDERIENAVLGGVAGATLGLAPRLKLGTLGRGAMAVRREALLSGMAIPKNTMQMIGNAGWAAVEQKKPGALKELFRLPENLKNYVDAMKSADPYTYSSIEHPEGGAGKGKLRFIQPSHHIGAIDKTDTLMLSRMGVPKDQLPRYMMNADQDVIRAVTNHPIIPENLRPLVRTLVRIGFPFTRFATNQLAGTANEAAHVINGIKTLTPDLRMALDIGSIGGGVALSKWAGSDPKRRLIATTLLPLFGPGQGLATLGAITAQGARGLGGGAFGGLSPLPEQGLNPAQFADPKRWFGFKPAALTATEKLGK